MPCQFIRRVQDRTIWPLVSKTPFHLRCSALSSLPFSSGYSLQCVGDKAIVRVQNPVVLSDLSEPAPDFALLKPRDNFYKDATPSARDVLLLIEVSDSTLRYDRDIKAPLYARHGIPETWIIDVANAQVTIHRDAGEQGYLSEFQPDDWQRVAPLQISDVGTE